MGRTDVLFRFLQLMGKNRPEDVDHYLKQLAPQDDRPIVDQLVDLIIAGDEQAYEKYHQAREELSLKNQDVESAKRPLLGFVDKWITFEAKLRSIVQSKLGNYTGPLSPSLLRKLEIFSDADDLKIFDTLRRLRTQIVHGSGVPESNIVEAETELSRLVTSLEGKYSIAPHRKPGASSVVLKRGLKNY